METKYYTLPEVAELFRISVACARQWIKKGLLQAIQVGRKILIPVEEITKFNGNLIKYNSTKKEK